MYIYFFFPLAAAGLAPPFAGAFLPPLPPFPPCSSLLEPPTIIASSSNVNSVWHSAHSNWSSRSCLLYISLANNSSALWFSALSSSLSPFLYSATTVAGAPNGANSRFNLKFFSVCKCCCVVLTRFQNSLQAVRKFQRRKWRRQVDKTKVEDLFDLTRIHKVENFVILLTKEELNQTNSE